MRKTKICGLDVQVCNEEEAGNTDFMVVSRAKDFSEKENDVWELDDNKSFPRDFFCFECKKQVVMSNGLFRVYGKKPRPEKIICTKCLVSVLNTK